MTIFTLKERKKDTLHFKNHKIPNLKNDCGFFMQIKIFKIWQLPKFEHHIFPSCSFLESRLIL